jgi:formate-dependent nitrite reductase membrane component NrfD
MIQTRPYEFMVKYTPQREWIERRGIMLWLAFFFVELGAGTFIVSSIFSSLSGMFIGWFLCGVFGGGFHLLYLGHPFRFWRIILSSGWKTSWISRGLIFVVLFLILGVIHLILVQWSSPVPGLLITAGVFAFCTVVYVGFVMNYVNSIPLWNTPLLPVLYVILGIWGGLGVTLIALLSTGATAIVGSVEEWSRIFLVAFIFIVFVYLFSIRYQGTTGKASVRQIVTGKWAPLFWVMVVVLGMALPVGVAFGSWIVGLTIPMVLLYLAVIFELLSDLALRYCILRCGLYAPLIPAGI